MRSDYEMDKYDELDDLYDTPSRERMHKPVNSRMATLKRTEDILNRYRKRDIL